MTIEVEGRLESIFLREKVRRRLRGWRREIRDRSKFEELCEKEMGASCENFGMPEWVGSEQAWKSWIETHDRIARETIGRYTERKHRRWRVGPVCV